MRSSVRRSAFGAVLAGTAVLSACGGQPAGGSAGPVSEAAATGSAVATPDDLRDGLLPAAAFGEDATVVGLSLEQLGQLPALAGLPQGTSIDPPLCGAALSMLPRPGDEPPTLVATGAYTDQVRTLEVLADGSALDGLELPVEQLLAACPTVTATGADGTVTTVSLAELGLPDDLGEARAGLQVTVTGPDGSVSALVAVVSQGSRALLLAQSGAAGALPDAQGFTDLLAAATDAADTD